MASNLRVFVDSLSELGLAFTELQVMKLAACFTLFPPRRNHDFSQPYGMIRSSPLRFGEIGRFIYHDDGTEGWELLGFSRAIQNMGVDERTASSASLNWGQPEVLTEGRWSTYTLYCPLEDTCEQLSKMTWYELKTSIEDFLWEDVFRESQEISEQLGIDIDSISLCHWVSFSVSLYKPDSANWNQVPRTLYYHRSPRPSTRREVEGFVSASNNPDSARWEDSFRQQEWGFHVDVKFDTYDMRDDWARQYERQLRKVMTTTPGSYPGAHIEEIL
ncbi:hypothetical protein BDV93DRAFT_526312 [Ceratobasidium sp. AG-I]|nr:hypothetical protein BDV93DRAFT_526312 [Ceratobasidium sp. AG-I]